MTSIPTKSQFAQATDLKYVVSGKRSEDHILKIIDVQLDCFHALNAENNADIKAAGQICVLGKLFFATDRWLKACDQKAPTVNSRRRPAVYAFYKVLVDRLAEDTGLTINHLPKWLEQTFGKDMGDHGVDVDMGTGSADYYDKETRDKYKLVFKGGIAYRQQWWDDSAKLTRANTASQSHNGAGVIAAMFNGYVVSMSGDFYSGPHAIGMREKHTGQFHSSYLSGNTVLCGGEIRINDGIVTHINNSSGHYQPDDANLASAVEALELEGVNLKHLLVTSFTRTERPADQFLRELYAADERRAQVAKAARGPSAKSRFEFKAMMTPGTDHRKIALETLKAHWTEGKAPVPNAGHGFRTRFECYRCNQDLRSYWKEMLDLADKAGGIKNVNMVVIPASSMPVIAINTGIQLSRTFNTGINPPIG
ncbi:hypothetical protein [Robbsia sp. KACC 23696]|uniref:hypothetical protein n=1 Tax=Robbsia sp. KACC 23696 TaxID=3149231 RepID=UPI00325B0D1A